MKVLLDEDVAHKLRIALSTHEVSTTVYLGWGGLKNGELLKRAEAEGFEVFITCDKKLSYQQNLTGRLLAVILISEQEWPYIKPHLTKIEESLQTALPGSFQLVNCSDAASDSSA